MCSSVGQSASFTSKRSLVQVQSHPPQTRLYPPPNGGIFIWRLAFKKLTIANLLCFYLIFFPLLCQKNKKNLNQVFLSGQRSKKLAMIWMFHIRMGLMKKTTAIASFLFLATLTGIAQATPQIATKAYVDSKTVQAGDDISVTGGRTVNATYASLQYDISSQDGLLPINGIFQSDGLIKVTTGAWGQVAPDVTAPASGGDVYAAIQEAIQNLEPPEYEAGAGISITDGVIAAKGDPDKNIKVYANEGIGIAMEEFDTSTGDDTHGAGLSGGISRVARIEQNNTGNITVTTDKWNEQWTVNDAPIRTQRIKYELNRKTNDVVAGRLISVTEVNTTEDELINNELGEKNYTISSTLYPGNGIVFDNVNCGRNQTCISLRTSSTSALSFNEDGELSLSGLSYDSRETEAAQGLENGTSRIASITQTDGIISVTTGDWVTSLDAENLTEENAGVPATAKAIVAAIDQSVAPVERTATEAAENAAEALRVANNAAADAAEALQAANNAIPKPDPNVCSEEGKRCVLTYGLNSDNELTYEWEVVTRAEGEQ